MTARLKHVAIVSDNYAMLGRFYEALFGLKSFAGAKADDAAAVTDGYVGLNVNPRAPGRQAGFEFQGAPMVAPHAHRPPRHAVVAAHLGDLKALAVEHGRLRGNRDRRLGAGENVGWGLDTGWVRDMVWEKLGNMRKEEEIPVRR